MVDYKGNLTISSGNYDTQVSDLLSDNMPDQNLKEILNALDLIENTAVTVGEQLDVHNDLTLKADKKALQNIDLVEEAAVASRRLLFSENSDTNSRNIARNVIWKSMQFWK
ncbi:hypothetical protein GJ496_006027 [Pomphorhynchus laevis]|nr:hypothetical protein GJ496_006027 [Pomphorhynchus laevis]